MNLKLLAYKLRKDTVDLICAGKAGHIGRYECDGSSCGVVLPPDEHQS